MVNASVDMDWVVESRIGLLKTDDPATSPEVQRRLEHMGFSRVVTVRPCDYSLCWGLPGSSLQHYQCRFSDYRNPTPRDLNKVNEYCLYELAHGRGAPIWIEHARVRGIVADSIRSFFEPGIGDIDSFIPGAMAAQRERALALPPEEEGGNRCEVCLERRCMSGLACHATSLETAAAILRCGRILSACKARGLPGEALAGEPSSAAGDPPDYFEYVMFGAGNCPGLDKLVRERAIGRPPTWEEFEKDFVPAVLFYFRQRDLIMHPGFCSDGYHMKIRDELRLDPYLAALVIPDGLRRSDELRELATTELPARKIVSHPFAGHSYKEWASIAYRAARELAGGAAE